MITDKEVVDDFSSFYNSGGRHKTKIDGKHTVPYKTWHDMVRRCYRPSGSEQARVYSGCTISSEWLDYQDFAEWYEGNKFKGDEYHLDKDILIAGNKVYSPAFCRLVPRDINNLLTDSKRARGVYPQGVSYKKSNNRFVSQIKRYGEVCHLGLFDTPNEAYQVYKLAKEDYVKSVANKWADFIDKDTYSSLINWSL